MSKAEKLGASADDWDARKLGHDEEFVKRAHPSHEAAVDNALGLQMISIRLQKQLLSDLKFIATAHNIGYQPLMRDILSRFVVSEKKQILREVMARREIELRAKEQELREAEIASKQAKPKKAA